MEFTPHPKNCSQFIDMTGHKFNNFEVVGYAGKLSGKSSWFCKCKCGSICKVRSTHIRNNKRNSCNSCRSKSNPANYKHGGTGTMEHKIYLKARKRCTDRKHVQYSNYGGRGIKFKFKTFSHFLDSLGERPSVNHSIERLDTNGHYEHGNCIWATTKEQNNNTRRNIFLEHNGVLRTLSEWAEEYRIPYHNFYYRYRMGYLDNIFIKVEKYAQT